MSESQPARPTIREVAKLAGVSTSTVSLVINDKGSISPATRERVHLAARTLGYQANPHGRGLRGTRNQIIGIALRSLDMSSAYSQPGVDHHLRLFGAAATRALDRGYSAMLVSRDVSAGPRPLWSDGFVIADPFDHDQFLASLTESMVPVVSVGRSPDFGELVPFVSTSAESTLALNHLKARGARRVALISGRERTAWHMRGEEAYSRWTRAQGMSSQMVSSPEESGSEGGALAARQLFESSPDIDAIICHTARHAAGASEYLRSVGLRIPDDVMIAACSDGEAARSALPPITAIDLRPEELGRQAVDLLVDRIENLSSRSSVLIDAELLKRESTGPSAGSASRSTQATMRRT
ncbi:MAG: LacI family transcriptional regulator [Actinobacteria bacterium]|nr:LacI family transcriptional regulator [Actinomycetota bacterium]MBU1610155.1 LacI family transcriptional regulator [Actinomycetota bacterium]MBU2316004.1 LacI family transcriptional regulator [Actinomycetota bacterium]MBU2383920.1 LacI family transcriptional regulator [Actinomycetota bacterium]